MEQERQMSPYVGPTFSDMSTTCCPTQHFGPEIANADIRQTQLRAWGEEANEEVMTTAKVKEGGAADSNRVPPHLHVHVIS